jgi:hypothetical protein
LPCSGPKGLVVSAVFQGAEAPCSLRKDDLQLEYRKDDLQLEYRKDDLQL